MALDHKISIQEVGPADISLGAIIIYDITGNYSVSNVGGWESPNPSIVDVTKTEFEFTDPDGNVTTIEDTERVLPNVNSLGIKITADLLGLSTITPGIWQIKTTYTIGGEEFCKIGYFAMYYEIQCALEKRTIEFDVSNPTSETNMRTMDLNKILCAAVKNAELGQQDTARDLLAYLRRVLEC